MESHLAFLMLLLNADKSVFFVSLTHQNKQTKKIPQRQTEFTFLDQISIFEG